MGDGWGEIREEKRKGGTLEFRKLGIIEALGKGRGRVIREKEKNKKSNEQQ